MDTDVDDQFSAFTPTEWRRRVDEINDAVRIMSTILRTARVEFMNHPKDTLEAQFALDVSVANNLDDAFRNQLVVQLRKMFLDKGFECTAVYRSRSRMLVTVSLAPYPDAT